jgi:hypothetical protein
MRPFLRINPFINLQPENLIPAYIDGEGASGQMLIGLTTPNVKNRTARLRKQQCFQLLTEIHPSLRGSVKVLLSCSLESVSQIANVRFMTFGVETP